MSQGALPSTPRSSSSTPASNLQGPDRFFKNLRAQIPPAKSLLVTFFSLLNDPLEDVRRDDRQSGVRRKFSLKSRRMCHTISLARLGKASLG